ncbi:MAG: TetR/AcrR family transcriptional regulator [Amphiplicatus sp.]
MAKSPATASRNTRDARRIGAREKLLAAALGLIRLNGFAATSVDALCAEAGVTKGAFFHHFASKEALGVAAAAHWSEVTGALFRDASYHEHADPLDRIFAYLEFRRALIRGAPAEFTCLVGTMVQERFAQSDAIRAACAESIFGHAETLEADFEAAIAAAGLEGEADARSLARHTQAALQGGFILAKASGGPAAAADSVDHLRRYLELLFGRPPPVRARAS